MRLTRSVSAAAVFLAVASGGCGGGAKVSSVAIESPEGTAYTNGTLTVEVAAKGVGTVTLLVNGSSLAAIHGKPFTYDWDTTSFPEGSYELVARAGALRSDPVTVVVDRTPPAVISRYPEHGSLDATLGDPFTVEFSEAILSSSANATSVAILDESGAAVPAAVTVDGNVLSIEPAAGLAVPNALSVSLSPVPASSITDLAGNALAPDGWSFTVPAWARLGGEFVAESAVHGFSPRMAIGPGDVPYVAWSQAYETSEMYVRMWTGREWASIGGVVNPSNPQGYVESLAVDGSGAPIVGWRDYTAPYTAYVSRWSGTDWELLGGGPLNKIQGNPAYHVRVTVDGSGDPLVSFVENDGPTPTIFVQRWNGSIWQDLGAGIALTGAIAYPGAAIVVDSLDLPVLAYVEAGDARVSRFDGTNWAAVGGALDVSLGNQTYGIAIVLDSSEEPVVAWGEVDPSTPSTTYYPGPQPNVYVARWLSGTSQWARMGNSLDTSVGHVARYPSLARMPGGEIVAGWAEYRESADAAYIAKWTGADWQFLGPNLNADASRFANDVQLLSDSQGQLLATWNEYEFPDGYVSSVVVRRFNGGATAPFGIGERVDLPACALPLGNIPATLSATGCFTGFEYRVPKHGLIPYDLNSPLWSDGAIKKRWFVLPAGTTIGYTAAGAWTFPDGTIFVKEFGLDAVKGDGSTYFPMETRFLVQRNATTYEGYSYKWRDDGSDADLLADVASVDTYPYLDGAVLVLDTHSFPSRANCLTCHNAAAGFVLGPQTPNMNRSYDYGRSVDNQIRAMNKIGLFGTSLAADADPSTLPRMPSPQEMAESFERRSRSYLSSNCSQCHRSGGSMPSKFFPWEETLAATQVCNAIVVGSPATSRLFIKVNATPQAPPSTGGNPMPPLARLSVDPIAANTISSWITGMAACP